MKSKLFLNGKPTVDTFSTDTPSTPAKLSSGLELSAGTRDWLDDSRLIVSHNYKMYSYTAVLDIYLFVLTATYKARVDPHFSKKVFFSL
jgi:hypothetical protein